MWMGGSAAGNIVRIRVDVREQTAHAIEALAEAPVEEVSRGMTYAFLDSLEYEHGARVVSSHTREGAQLLARLQAEAMPEDLVELGFVDARDFWPPWCAALDEGTIASVAFTARLSSLGAEVGVATPLRLADGASRQQRQPSGRRYRRSKVASSSTARTPPISSQRVADRLRLNFVGPSLLIR
jgi:hypothetical protein